MGGGRLIPCIELFVFSSFALLTYLFGSGAIYNCMNGWPAEYVVVNPGLDNHLFALLPLSLLCLILCVAYIANADKHRRFVNVVAVFTCVLIAASSAYAWSQITRLQDEAQAIIESRPDNWTGDEMFEAITFYEFSLCGKRIDSDEELYPVFVGHSNCEECASFISALHPTLTDCEEIIWAFDIESVKDASELAEMNDLLGDLGVNSAPCLLVFGPHGVEAKWTSASGNKEAIERYFDDGMLVD